MLILIDGYNLLFGTTITGNILKDDRNNLIQNLVGMLQLAKMEATIIFDAHFQDSPESKGHLGPLEMIFTEKGEIADDLILKKIKSSIKPHLILVVTSDKKLGSRARRLLAKVISTKEWLTHLSKQAAKAYARPKKTPETKTAPLPPVKTLSRSKDAKNDFGYYLDLFEERYESIKEDVPAHQIKNLKRKKLPKKVEEEPHLSEEERWLHLFEKKLKGDGA